MWVHPPIWRRQSFYSRADLGMESLWPNLAGYRDFPCWPACCSGDGACRGSLGWTQRARQVMLRLLCSSWDDEQDAHLCTGGNCTRMLPSGWKVWQALHSAMLFLAPSCFGEHRSVVLHFLGTFQHWRQSTKGEIHPTLLLWIFWKGQSMWVWRKWTGQCLLLCCDR